MLIQGKSNQERHRVDGDQLIGLVGVGEVETVGQLGECYLQLDIAPVTAPQFDAPSPFDACETLGRS
jgi:hypothetical protein